MSKYLPARAADIASNLVNAWVGHSDALERHALPYLDHLMDAILAEEPTHPNGLVNRLCGMAPGLQYGTARRLVDLKFGHPHHGETLVAASRL